VAFEGKNNMENGQGRDEINGRHLIVVMHGMWGSTSHMNEIVQAIESKSSSPHRCSLIYNCPVNHFFYTFQGIDICGWRLKQDLKEFISCWTTAHPSQPIQSISFIGYSAGGLFNRYCVGLLFQESFFQEIKPIHFITIATPHLGIRNNSRVSSGRLMNSFADLIVGLYAGRTGQQMALIDDDDTIGNQLLYEMSLPNSVFMKGLSLFPHLFIYSNGRADNTVPFCTSSLSQRNNYKSFSSSAPTSLPLKQEEDDSERTPTLSPSLSPLSSSSSPLLSPTSPPPLSSRYQFIVTQERIDSDQTPIPSSKPIEYDLYPTLKLLLLFILGFPLVILHCSIFFLVLRIPSLCYSFPSNWQEKMIPRSNSNNGRRIFKDSCPLLILQHLRQLPIYRVVALLPGPHTHGSIICRGWKNPGGMEVITHLVDDVLLSLHPIDANTNPYQQKLEECLIQNHITGEGGGGSVGASPVDLTSITTSVDPTHHTN
jgi:hypothetical protein